MLETLMPKFAISSKITPERKRIQLSFSSDLEFIFDAELKINFQVAYRDMDETKKVRLLAFVKFSRFSVSKDSV